MLEFNISHQNIIRQDSFSVVSGSQNYLKAKFNFVTDDWNDVDVITVIFTRKNGRTYNVVLDDNRECLVPWEVLDTEGSFTVSLYGGNLITVDTNEIKVKKSGFSIGAQPEAPTPSVYNQIIALVQNAVTTAQSVRDDADEGMFDGNGISETRLNDDYTLTFEFTDGTSWTSASIRGEQGEEGIGISSVQLNEDYTLTITLTNGQTWTSTSIRGEKGNGIKDVKLNGDYTLTFTFDDDTTWTSDSIRGQRGNGIESTVLNDDYTLTINYTDGDSWTSASIRGEEGYTPVKGVDYWTQEDIDSVIKPIVEGKQDKLVEGNNITIDPTTNVISANWNTDDYYTKDDVDTELAKKQNTLTPGENIHIDENGVISADGGDLSNYYTKDEVNTELSKKQDELTQGSNIIISDSNVISADLSDYYNKSTVDSKLSEKQGTLKQGNNITISEDNTISAIVDLSNYYNKTTVDTKLDAKQNKLTQGANININDDGVISAIDTKYTAGEGIHISDDNKITADLSSVYRACGSVATYDDLPTENVRTGDVYDVLDTDMNYVALVDEEGNIAWDALSSTTDLTNYYTKTETDGLLSAKQDILTPGNNITIEDGVISAKSGVDIEYSSVDDTLLIVKDGSPSRYDSVKLYYTTNNTYDFSKFLTVNRNVTNDITVTNSDYGRNYTNNNNIGNLGSVITGGSITFYYKNKNNSYTRFVVTARGSYNTVVSYTSSDLSSWTVYEREGGAGGFNPSNLYLFDGRNLVINTNNNIPGCGTLNNTHSDWASAGYYQPVLGMGYLGEIDSIQINDSPYEVVDSKARTNLANKQDKLSDVQIDAVNSGITSEKVETYDGYATNKQDTLVLGEGLHYSEDGKLNAEGTTYTAGDNIVITDNNVIDAKLVVLTQAEYNALSEEEKNNGTTYYVSDGHASGSEIITAGTIKPYVYDEEEALVGIYEGKPLYRKHVITSPLGSEQVSYLYSTEGLDVVNLNFILVNPDGNQGKPESKIGNSYYETSTTYYRAQNNEGYIQLIRGNTQSWSTWYGDFIIEYTKTIDAEGSGEGLMPYGYVGSGGSSNPNYIFKDGEFNPIFDIKLVQENNCFNEIRGSKLFLSAINTQGGYARMYYTQVPIPRNKYEGVYLEFAQYNIIWSGYDTRIAFAKLSDITSPTGTPLSFAQSISGGINYYDLSSYNNGSEDMCLLFLCGLRDSYLTEITLTNRREN